MQYASTVWSSCDKNDMGRVFKLQKRAARVICYAHNQASSVHLFNKLNWIPLYEEIKIAKCCIVYKRINNNVPAYIEDSLKLNNQVHSRNTRYCNSNLICAKYNRKTEGGRTFSVTTSQLWNALSLNLRNANSSTVFKNNYREILFKKQQDLRHFII